MGNHLTTSTRHRLRVLSTLALALTFIRRSSLHLPLHHPTLAALNERLKRYQPFHIILLTLCASYAFSHLSLLIGLNAPIPSLSTEPDVHYTSSFSNARYFLSTQHTHTLLTPLTAAVDPPLTATPPVPLLVCSRLRRRRAVDR